MRLIPWALMFAAISFPTHQSPAPPATDLRIASVQVKGIHRYAAEDVVRLSGLIIGKSEAVEGLNAAANRLASTGLFNSVKYTYQTTGRQMSVTFDVEEAPWNIGVVLDNFVWMPDDQLVAEVRKEVPSFDGTVVPLDTAAADFIRAALQKVLVAKGIPGRVDVSTHEDLKRGVSRYVFLVKDPAPRTCALHVAGAAAVSERDLLESVQELAGQDYSRLLVTAASDGTLRDIYRRRGLLRAAFGPPSVATDACDGVSVTINVTEGPAFTWDHAEWTGNVALPATKLEAALAMEAGQTANALKVDDGLRTVHTAYEAHGYMLQTVATTLRLDDAARRAVFQFQVTEGPQFRMGTLLFQGITAADAEALRKKWPVQEGDVFDASAVRTYQLEVLSPLKTRAGGRPAVGFELDQKKTVVNVRVAFQ